MFREALSVWAAKLLVFCEIAKYVRKNIFFSAKGPKDHWFIGSCVYLGVNPFLGRFNKLACDGFLTIVPDVFVFHEGA